jgi:hypothetical protein
MRHGTTGLSSPHFVIRLLPWLAKEYHFLPVAKQYHRGSSTWYSRNYTLVVGHSIFWYCCGRESRVKESIREDNGKPLYITYLD